MSFPSFLGCCLAFMKQCGEPSGRAAPLLTSQRHRQGDGQHVDAAAAVAASGLGVGVRCLGMNKRDRGSQWCALSVVAQEDEIPVRAKHNAPLPLWCRKQYTLVGA